MLRGFAEKLVMDTTATIRSRSTACSRVSLSTAGSSWISYGKEFAHLSYKRLDVPPDEKGWIFVSIGREPAATFEHWAGLVPEHRQPARLAPALRPARRGLRDPECQKNVIRPAGVPTQIFGPPRP